MTYKDSNKKEDKHNTRFFKTVSINVFKNIEIQNNIVSNHDQYNENSYKDKDKDKDLTYKDSNKKEYKHNTRVFKLCH